MSDERESAGERRDDRDVNPASTVELLDRARQGDQAAPDRLFARYAAPLRRWASGRLPRWARDLADTDNLVQEALLQTFRRIEQFDARGTGALYGYLRQVVLNRIQDELRRKARRPDPTGSMARRSMGECRRSNTRSAARWPNGTNGRSPG